MPPPGGPEVPEEPVPGPLDAALYRSIVDQSPDPVSLSRPADGRLVMVNRAWCELTGIPAAQALGRSSVAMGVWVRPEERAAAIAEFRRQAVPVLAEFALRSRDGSERRLLGTVRLVQAGDEELALFMGRDFTDSYRIQEALEASTRELQGSEARFRLLFEQAPLGIAVVDSASGRFLAVNPRMGELFGYAPEALLEATYQAITHADHLAEDLRSAADLLAGTVAEVQKEKRFLHRSGRIVWGRLRMVRLPPLAGEAGRHLVLVEDITRQKLAEEEQALLQQRLFQAQKLESLGLLVAGVAHTMNNVLAVIIGTASLREQAAPDPADLEAYRGISRVCRRGKEVVKSLIQFGRPALSARAPFELRALLGEVRELMEASLAGRVRIVAESAGEPLWILGEAGGLHQALVNLCFNGMEAMAGSGTLVLGAAGAGPDWVEVRVEDSGRGMPPDLLARALEPFYTTKHESTGAGLGLSLVYGVVTAHGGTLGLSSEPGRGTRVTLRLPRIPAPDAPAAASAAPPPVNLRKVLLVDDEEDVRILMTRMLRKSGVAQVETAAGGEAALDCLGAGDLPEVVILDQNMPGMTGVQLMARIRDRHPLLPILFSSGQADIESLPELHQPRVAVISKPFTLEEIQAKLGHFAYDSFPAG